MSTDLQPNFHLKDIIGMNMIEQLNQRDKRVQEYYQKLDDPNISFFNQLMSLLARIVLAIGENVSEFVPKFPKPSQVQEALVLSAGGSFRALRVANKLLLEGYILEAHTAMRMVEQWCEVINILEDSPEVANEILITGVTGELKEKINNKRHKSHSPNSEFLLKELRTMKKSFNKLSQRAHVLPTAIRLSGIRKNQGYFVNIAGVCMKDGLQKDTHALVGYTKNVLNMLGRHFTKIPSDWQKEFVTIKHLMRNKLWVVWDLSPYNVPANSVCTILIQNNSSDTAYHVGVREIDSSIDRKIKLSPKGVISVTVNADSDSKIETYAEDSARIDFTHSGFFPT
jgi:hypothetical protein